MPIFVQNRFNRFHHFSIGFTQLSNLFQPFAVGSNQFLASYGLFHCVFHWISAVFQPIESTARFYPGLSSVVQSISSFQQGLSLVSSSTCLGSISRETFCSKVHFRGLDLTSYPLGMILSELFSGKFMHFYFSIFHFSRKWPSRMNNIYAEQ